MSNPNVPEGQSTQTGPRKVPPQVEKMLASAKEMEAVLTRKLAKIDAVSLEKSEMAKQEATKIKSDVEEIKRLSLVQTKEGEDALKAKIVEVNQRIEATTRKAAELQTQLVTLYEELHEELSARGAEVRTNILNIPGLSEDEKQKMTSAVNEMVQQGKEKADEARAVERKIKDVGKKVQDIKIDTNMSKNEILKMLDDELDLILKRTEDEKEELTQAPKIDAKPGKPPKRTKK